MTVLIFVAFLFFAVLGNTAAQSSAPAYSIEGVVVDAVTGNPIPHAELSLEIQNDEITVAADNSGRFRFDHLEPGKYRLYAGALGYVRQGLDQHGAFFTGVVVGNGIDSEHVTFRLHPQAVIYGRVSDQNGEAVRNASVQLFSLPKRSTEHPSVLTQAQTNDLGEYRFAHLLAGKYCLVVQTQPWYIQAGITYVSEPNENATRPWDSFNTKMRSDPALDVVYPVTFYPGVTDERSAGELHLSEGEVEPANIQLRAVPAVHLRLSNLPSGDKNPPNFGVFQKVFSTLAMGLPVRFAQISPGEFELAGLPPGELTFTVNRNVEPGQSPRTIEANVSGGDTLDASKPLPSANVSGRVIVPEGFPEAAEATIMLLRDGDQNASARLNKDGTFSMAAVPVGTYTILVNVPGQPKYIRKVSASGARTSGRGLFIAATNDVHLAIVMGQAVGEIAGIATHDRHAVDGVMVLLVPESGETLDDESRMDQSDSDGSFLLGSIIPGKYRLLAIQDGWGLDWRNPSVLNPYLEKAQPLEIVPNEKRNLTVEVQSKRN